MKIANTMIDLIGNTPMVYLNKLTKNCNAKVIAKLEFFNPCSSVKDRIGKSMIEKAEKENKINKDTLIIEPTSGNTGISLAFICAIKGYKLILTMPESMSLERRKILLALGAKIELTPANLGMKGAIAKAEELVSQNKNSFILSQFTNLANPEIHIKTTANEIWNDTDGKADILVAGIGTGGTFTGISEFFKAKNPEFISIAVEPESSAVLSGASPSQHKIQGIGAGFIPKVLKTNLIDEIIKVSNETAYAYAKKLVLEEGILAGISSGAAVYSAIQIAKRKENKDKLIVVILPDSAERYMSVPELF